MAKDLIRGRFQKSAAQKAADYSVSLQFDRRLYSQDIAGSVAHAAMLAKQGIITEAEAKKIIAGLMTIQTEIEQNEFKFKPELEDIHMNIEARLIELAGPAGEKLHTARSRNDQVATDLRMYLKNVIDDTILKIRNLQSVLLDISEKNLDAVLPGYTHLQPAQPVLLAHHLLAYFEMLQRDCERLKNARSRVDVMPLGSGALAGVNYDIDRALVAQILNFGGISRNSMDAVSDRDFVLEYEAAACVSMMHLSRLAEELVIWSSAAFNFIVIDDAYSTGSSMMPQKKNPDIAELARGKTGRVYGNLIAALTTMKGLPLTYNRDLQEDKEALFDTVDTLSATLDVFAGMLPVIIFNKEKMAAAVDRGYLLATDLADYLVHNGETFRKAHAAVAKLVAYAVEQEKTFSELTIEEYKKFNKKFAADVYKINVKSALTSRNVPGGTAPVRVKKALAEARKILRAAE